MGSVELVGGEFEGRGGAGAVVGAGCGVGSGAGAGRAGLLAVPLRGRGLRFVLVGELMVQREMTVAQMVGLVEGSGFKLTGRASKVISDALRWEVLRGRVVRAGRGVYRYVGAPPSTARRIRMFAIRCLAWAAAARVGHEPPLPPRPRISCPPRPDWVDRPRNDDDDGPPWSYDPPWSHLCWLWVS